MMAWNALRFAAGLDRERVSAVEDCRMSQAGLSAPCWVRVSG